MRVPMLKPHLHFHPIRLYLLAFLCPLLPRLYSPFSSYLLPHSSLPHRSSPHSPLLLSSLPVIHLQIPSPRSTQPSHCNALSSNPGFLGLLLRWAGGIRAMGMVGRNVVVLVLALSVLSGSASSAPIAPSPASKFPSLCAVSLCGSLFVREAL